MIYTIVSKIDRYNKYNMAIKMNLYIMTRDITFFALNR